MDIENLFKSLPSIDSILEDDTVSRALNELSRKGVLRIAREVVDEFRDRIKSKGLEIKGDAIREAVVNEVRRRVEEVSSLKQRRVINATGVVLHTNLGRAPLGGPSCEAVIQAASGYVDLEVDLEEGIRTDRTRRVRQLLSLLTGAEDSLIVNNNAAAVFLVVHTFSRGGAVAVSRGELIEIGGSFRLPEILAAAASRVIEVGTTNKTHIEDYIEAIDKGATLLLKVHTSNYRVVGFAEDVSLSELVKLGKQRGVPVMYDQGSGVLYPFSKIGIEGEESLDDIMKTGVDIVSFSTDKVLGGPQGGAIVGSKGLIERLKRNHLSRALRVDKLTLAALERLLIQYWKGDFDDIPSIRMIKLDYESLKRRASRLRVKLAEVLGEKAVVKVVEGESSIGGGSYPTNSLRSPILEINLRDGFAVKLARALRSREPALMVRIKDDTIFIDLRTVAEDEEDVILDIMKVGVKEIFSKE